MSAQTDFYFSIERAAGLTLDATCAARAAGHGGLPHPHRRLLNRAVRELESAQQDLFTARHDPWSASPRSQGSSWSCCSGHGAHERRRPSKRRGRLISVSAIAEGLLGPCELALAASQPRGAAAAGRARAPAPAIELPPAEVVPGSAAREEVAVAHRRGRGVGQDRVAVVAVRSVGAGVSRGRP